MTGESGAVNTFFMLKQPHSGTKIARIRVCQRNDQYGYSDPVLNTDPSGRFCVPIPWTNIHIGTTCDGGGGSWGDGGNAGAGGVVVNPPPIGVDAPEVANPPNPLGNVPPPRPMTMPEIPPAAPAAGAGAAEAGTAEVIAGGPSVWCVLALLFAASLLGGDAPIPQTQPHPQPTPAPTSVPTPTALPGKVIVELGAGDYTNAIAIKRANPGARVIATNLASEWQQGKDLYDAGIRGSQEMRIYPQLRMYVGWLAAKSTGVDVGLTQPYQNQDVPSGIADVVYSISPRPRDASVFGVDGARIAKMQSGTVVAVTSGITLSRDRFEMGFNSLRSGSVFVTVPGTPYGTPHLDWEAPPYETRMYVVP